MTDSSRRSAILRATIEEVVKNGIDGTSIHRIAEAAGVSTGLVLYHFKSKEELITAAWVESVHYFYTRSADDVGPDGGLRHLENSFRLQFRDRDESMPSWRFWLELWARAARSPELRTRHSERMREVRESYTRLLTVAAERGELAEGSDPELIGDLIHTLVYGLAVKSTLDDNVISPQRAYEIGALALDLIRRPAGGLPEAKPEA